VLTWVGLGVGVLIATAVTFVLPRLPRPGEVTAADVHPGPTA
jgi:hypothetical protein